MTAVGTHANLKGYYAKAVTNKFVYIAGEKRAQVGTVIQLSICEFGSSLSPLRTIETGIYFETCYSMEIVVMNHAFSDGRCEKMCLRF